MTRSRDPAKKLLKNAIVFGTLSMLLSLVPASMTLTLPAYAEGSDNNSTRQADDNSTNTENHNDSNATSTGGNYQQSDSNATETNHENGTRTGDDGNANANSSGTDAQATSNSTSGSHDGEKRYVYPDSNSTVADGHHMKKWFNASEYFKKMMKHRMELMAHSKHFALNSTSIVHTLAVNSTFSLTASGKAVGFAHEGAGANSRDSNIVLNFSVSRSSERIISIKLTGGTFTIGNETLNISSGHAYLLTNHPRLFVFGYGPSENAASTTGHEHLHRLVRLYVVPANLDELRAQLSSGSLNVSSMPVKVIGMENTPHSQWDVLMTGQVSMT